MSSRRSSRSQDAAKIDALDFDQNRKRSASNSSAAASGASSPEGLLRDDESLLSNVVEGIIQQDRQRMKRELAKYLSYASAILSCLCAGSLTGFSLYGHLFLSRLHYNQYQINAISIAAELAMYLPVPIFGYLVDRHSPRPVSLVSAILFAAGYFTAAFTYRSGPESEGGWPFGMMVVAFCAIGMATAAMYLAAVTACVKNFGQSKYKGIALALPIASFGLSGMWQSLVGSNLLYEPKSDGTKGDVDVFRYFIFLGSTLLAVGLLGAVAQIVVNEEELIDDAVDELQRSGLLEDSPFFRHSILHDASTHANGRGTGHPPGYGTIPQHDRAEDDEEADLSASMLRVRDEEERKKTWLLNNETRRFLYDPTMWTLALGFFLVTGPVETYVNNLGTMIATLYPPGGGASESSPYSAIPASNSPAAHVSILAFTSTFARFAAGILSDLLSPATPDGSNPQYRAFTPSASATFPDSFDQENHQDHHHHQHSTHPTHPHHLSSSLTEKPKRFTVSRLTLLILTALLLALAMGLLLSPLISATPALFPLITALIGFVNGAAFALVPLLISAVWGVQNFGTNWGIVATVPAAGAAFWSALYSVGYQAHVGVGGGGGGGGGGASDVLCLGRGCWEGVVGGMMGSAVLAALSWTWVGWGRGGWWERGVVV